MEERKYSIGSLFSGIGGFELGLERAIPGSFTKWQVEQESYCQKILAKHWPEAEIYDDVRGITKNNVERVDVLCGGFPCQDISIAGNKGGLSGKKSNLWWEMHRIIGELRPRIAVMENVTAITFRGLGGVLGSLSEMGYNLEWCSIRASSFGAPHRRERWFCIGYLNTNDGSKLQGKRKTSSNTISKRIKKQSEWKISMEKKRFSQCRSREARWDLYGGWEGFPTQSPVYRRNDGVSHRVDRIRALGNAIVPQCSEWIGKKIWESGLLLD